MRKTELEELIVSIQVAAQGVEETISEITRAQEKAYKALLSVVDHKKKMNELSAQEEIRVLERIKSEYARTAEQIMDIDERIYAAREKLRAQEETQLTKLHDAVTQALSNRYEAQRQAEQQRIDESSAAWTRWSKDTCAAITAQMDALDEKEKAEDREAARAQKLREIDRIRQQMAHETDDYNLRQLKKQLEQAEKDWASTQSDWARSDERSALNAQMERVKAQAQAEIEALRAQSEQVNAHYAQLMEESRLSQQAHSTLLDGGKESVAALLAQYAPAYAAAGKSFGEQFYEGFAKTMGDLTGWFASIESAVNAHLSSENASAQAAQPGTTVSQVVHFNVPVESPGDVARRMEEVNLALLQML